MSQQEMSYGEMDSGRPRPSFAYEGAERFEEPASYTPYGQKLSGQALGLVPRASQRLALAIVSLILLMMVIFGLIGVAMATHPPDWAVFPILFIILVFAVASVLINAVFNRKS